MLFERLADRRPAQTIVERDDGVVFAMRGAGGGPELPHDLVHALVELELGIPDGIWGCVADGVVWRSMRHVSGRRPPHADQRSERLKRERAEAIARAEGLADRVTRVARGTAPADEEWLAAAAEALRSASERWAALRPGETWVVEWPRLSRAGGSARRRRPGGRAARS